MSRIQNNLNGLWHSCVLRAGIPANEKRIKGYVDRSLMLVTALPVIGYDKLSKIALDNDLTLKDAVLKLGFVSERSSIASSIRRSGPPVRCKGQLSDVLVTDPISENAYESAKKGESR